MTGNYTESETGALMCGTCDRYIDGIGENACVCCATCDGTGGRLDVSGATPSDHDDCDQCNGTGRKAVV
jgi:hypothetical protein